MRNLFHSMFNVQRSMFDVRILLFLSLTVGLSADIPRKAPLTRYTGLWTNSPFTSKPPPPEPTTTINPLEDFTLTGIAPVPGGYRITIVSKKDPDLKEIIEPGSKSDYKIVSVNRTPGKALGTTVVLSAGNIQGTVAFEPEMLVLKAPPAQQQPQQANLPPGVEPPANKDQNSAQRQPRPRIVPPPQPAANSNTKSNDSNRARDRRR